MQLYLRARQIQFITLRIVRPVILVQQSVRGHIRNMHCFVYLFNNVAFDNVSSLEIFVVHKANTAFVTLFNRISFGLEVS